MGKKKKNKKGKKKNKNIEKASYSNSNLDCLIHGSKKSMNKKFNKAINDREEYRIQLFEADKRQRKKERRKINKHEAEFYTDMEGLKCRKKMAKEWEETGFLDRIIRLLQQISPLVATLAKIVGFLIISFLSIDTIKATIKPRTLNKLNNIYDIAMSI